MCFITWNYFVWSCIQQLMHVKWSRIIWHAQNLNQNSFNSKLKNNELCKLTVKEEIVYIIWTWQNCIFTRFSLRPTENSVPCFVTIRICRNKKVVIQSKVIIVTSVFSGRNLWICSSRRFRNNKLSLFFYTIEAV